MSGILDFHINPPYVFFNEQSVPFENSDFVVLGVPMDLTSSFRPGSRFAPYRIRKVSGELESYCFEAHIDFDSLKVCDLGDLIAGPDVNTTLRKLSSVILEIVKNNKFFVVIGGEHTITLGEISALMNVLDKKVKILILDAHMDLRDEYPLGLKISHATVTRRIGEKIGFENMLLLGVRAASKEEVRFCESIDFKKYLTAETIISNPGILKESLASFLKPGDNVLISIDIDVLDPAFAPGVSNPEPLGLSPHTVMEVLREAVNFPANILGIDVVEVSPPYDISDTTSFIASRIIKNTLCYVELSKKREG